MRNKILQSLRKISPDFAGNIIFDVGANIGQSAIEFAEAFPEATIHAFEPIPAAFLELRTAVENLERVHLHSCALGATNGEACMLSRGSSTGNRIINSANRNDESETVAIRTGDDICAKHNIAKIDFLKIDAEGHDLSVLAGFAGMLRAQNINIIQVEVGVSPDNKTHCSYFSVAEFVFAFGYRLLGLYSLTHRLGRSGPFRGAMYGDAVFILENSAR